MTFDSRIFCVRGRKVSLVLLTNTGQGTNVADRCEPHMVDEDGCHCCRPYIAKVPRDANVFRVGWRESFFTTAASFASTAGALCSDQRCERRDKQ